MARQRTESYSTQVVFARSITRHAAPSLPRVALELTMSPPRPPVPKLMTVTVELVRIGVEPPFCTAIPSELPPAPPPPGPPSPPLPPFPPRQTVEMAPPGPPLAWKAARAAGAAGRAGLHGHRRVIEREVCGATA